MVTLGHSGDNRGGGGACDYLPAHADKILVCLTASDKMIAAEVATFKLSAQACKLDPAVALESSMIRTLSPRLYATYTHY